MAKQLWAIIILAGGFVVLAAILGAMYFGSAASKPGTTFGEIYVDTPEVYSRERLVNDRFQQDAWLRKKLGEEPKQGLQASAGASHRASLGVTLGAGRDAQTPPKEEVDKPEQAPEIQDTPIEQFRDALAYREEVRNEILENQLDDRHDIAGNTLYRLKFDATVLPRHDTSAYAMVEVTITGPSKWQVGDAKAEGRPPTPAPGNADERTRRLLEDSAYASYVEGLDAETVKFYRGVYEDWVREIQKDPSQYSEDEIRYGPLQGYLAVKDADPFIVRKETRYERFETKEALEEARSVLRAHGVPPEYQETPVMQVFDDNGEVEEVYYLSVATGLANFISDLRNHRSVIYTYAVTPKERIQRVSGESDLLQTLGLGVEAERSGIGADLTHSSGRTAQANAIMRQPQVVGYSPSSGRSGEATMGWLIGPRFRIPNDPREPVSFRHVPTQHTLTGIVSVPSWWQELNLDTRTYWLDEHGARLSAEGVRLIDGAGSEQSDRTTVALPAGVEGIVDILDPKRREPQVADQDPVNPLELRACERGTVIIRGSQLWRSTVVTLGGQRADTIEVLPNMEGIIATFETVRPAESARRELVVWTSEGEAKAGDVAVSDESCKRPRGEVPA